MKKVCVIGGGPAGMMAAYSAAQGQNVQVHLFEKYSKPGRKLMITGKGRCNLTNTASMDDFLDNIPRNRSFLYSALSSFSNIDLVALLNENGLKTKVERGGRVFPESDKAADVVDFFVTLMRKSRVSVCYGKKVMDVRYNNNEKEYNIYLQDSEMFKSDAVIIATGGVTYPQTGSTGDGYKIASSIGHSVTKLYPSLVALRTKENFGGLSGLTLKNVAVSIHEMGGKTVYEDFGEMLFSHYGVSGPVILSGSARIAERVGSEEFTLIIDFKPALDKKTLDMRLLKDFNKNKNKEIVNALADLLPKSIIPVIVASAGIMPRERVNEITKSERKALVNTLKAFPITITGAEGFDSAIITRGGVDVSQINPKTMESRLRKGLYFAGEVIDIDAYTGGFNLQIAFSTGFLAGKYASR